MWLSNWHSRCLEFLQWCTGTWNHEPQGTLCHNSRTGNPDTLSLCVGSCSPPSLFIEAHLLIWPHRWLGLCLRRQRGSKPSNNNAHSFSEGQAIHYFCTNLFSLSLYTLLVLHWTETPTLFFNFSSSTLFLSLLREGGNHCSLPHKAF